jgi:hypothetical protein
MTTKKKQTGTAPLAADWLPAWVSTETWQAFREHRMKIKKPMTEYAERLVLKRLDGLRLRGHDPNSLLDDAIEYGTQTVYEPRRVAARQQTYAEVNREAKAEQFRAMAGVPKQDDNVIDMEAVNARRRLG